MLRRSCATLALASLLAISLPAAAVQQHPPLPDGLELVGGRAARPLRTVSAQAPAAAAPRYARFLQDAGGFWVASWDEATGVPLRIFGSGLWAPGSVASAAAAESFARMLLARHLDLFAPGAAPDDLVLSANEREDTPGGARRIVAFAQTHAGLPVRSGQLSLQFRHDRLIVIGSEALPAVTATAPGAVVDAAIARATAEAWLGETGAAEITAGAVAGPLVLPIVGPSRVLGYEVVVRVEVVTAGPPGRWDVYLDARSGARVAREQVLRFAEATVRFNAPVRWPGADRSDYPAPFVRVEIGETNVDANAAGVFQLADPGPTEVTVLVQGKQVMINNVAGLEATAPFTATAGADLVWNAAEAPETDAQLSAYIHAHLAKEYGKAIAPDMKWLDLKLLVKVNVDDQCNAFYDGQALNFFKESEFCENTARIADVVYHEFGHGFHHHAIIPGAGEFEPALTEGLADYFAVSFTGDPAMGRGFFYTEEPLRDLDPPNGEYVWPDAIGSDPHQTGLILGGALWDLRKLLVDKHGAAEGATLTTKLFHLAMRSAVDIPSMYPEMLAADDDDGDLSNGTPNVCEIVEAFSRHGLRTINVTGEVPSLAPPTQDGYHVALHVTGLFAQCPNDAVESVALRWRLAKNPNQTETVPMAGGPVDFAADIPAQADGEVVLFRIDVALTDGSAMSFPDNPADPMYQLFVGQVTPLYCTDFETDPTLDGWTHALSEGVPEEGADDWQWGEPQAPGASGDPPAAFSGTRVFGNDLGGGKYDGKYQPEKTTYARSPAVDASGHDHVRLQYRRWLGVEDGYFDRARIAVNGQPVWTNFASASEDSAKVHHRDREWRFHDLDITTKVDPSGMVQVEYALASDEGLQLGGWTLDDFCIVAFAPTAPPEPVCGNGLVETGEECDDGNAVDGDGCDSSCRVEPEEPIVTEPPPLGHTKVQPGCACRWGAPGPDERSVAGMLGAAVALGLGLRRRRPSGPGAIGPRVTRGV